VSASCKQTLILSEVIIFYILLLTVFVGVKYKVKNNLFETISFFN